MSVTFTTGQFREIDGIGTVLAHDDDRDYEVNVSNANARTLLDRLGYDTENGLVGSATADDFLGRVLTANVGHSDDGVERATTKIPGGATYIDMGVRPGYYDEKMSYLADVASIAKSLDLMIVWA